MEGSYDEDIEEIFRFLFPSLSQGITKALAGTLKKATYFVSFNDIQRYIFIQLEQFRLKPSELEKLSSALERLYKTEKAEIPLKIAFGEADERAIEYATKLHDFYLGKFFQGDIQIRQRAVKWMSEYYFREGNPIGKGQQGIEEFLDRFGNYIKPQAEWKARQIIDTSVNFLRNSARLRAMHSANIKHYRWDATGDRLTCPACRSMDGRVFEVKDAIRVLDMLETSGDASLIKDLRPIITEPQKIPSSKIQTKFPPLHPHCRCRAVMETEEALPTVVERPANVPPTPAQLELEEEYRAFTPQELSNRIRAHMGSDWLRPVKGAKGVKAYKRAKSEFEKHFRKHAHELGFKSPEEYKKASYDVIKNPDTVYVERSKGKTYYHFIKDDKIVISEDDSLRIISFYQLDEERWKDFKRDAYIRIL